MTRDKTTRDRIAELRRRYQVTKALLVSAILVFAIASTFALPAKALASDGEEPEYSRLTVTESGGKLVDRQNTPNDRLLHLSPNGGVLGATDPIGRSAPYNQKFDRFLETHTNAMRGPLASQLDAAVGAATMSNPFIGLAWQGGRAWGAIGYSAYDTYCR